MRTKLTHEKSIGHNRATVMVLTFVFMTLSVTAGAMQWPMIGSEKQIVTESRPDARLANGGVIAADSVGESDVFWRTLQALGAIVIISGIGIGGFFLVRKFAPGVIPGTDARMKVLTRLPLGNRQSMIIARVGERVLVVGVSPGRIDFLSEINDFQEVQDLSYGFEFSNEIQKVRSEFDINDSEIPDQEEATSEDVRNEIQWLRDRLDGYGDRVEKEYQS
ncbi:MAG: flagellar biosynthetic protein FliO [Planctomycetota bacterium]